MESEIREEGFWTKINRRLYVVLEELKKESVAGNPVKPVDCCNSPVYGRKTEPKTKT